MILNSYPFSKFGRTILSGIPEGLDGIALVDLATSGRLPVIHVARDDSRLSLLAELLKVYAHQDIINLLTIHYLLSLFHPFHALFVHTCLFVSGGS